MLEFVRIVGEEVEDVQEIVGDREVPEQQGPARTARWVAPRNGKRQEMERTYVSSDYVLLYPNQASHTLT